MNKFDDSLQKLKEEIDNPKRRTRIARKLHRDGHVYELADCRYGIAHWWEVRIDGVATQTYSSRSKADTGLLAELHRF